MALLMEFRDACDITGIQERVATFLVSYFMKEPVSSSLKARLLPWKMQVTGLHDEC